jgi:hypothetical protein
MFELDPLQRIRVLLRNHPDIDDDDDDDDSSIGIQELGDASFDQGQLPPPLYPMGALTYKECIVCLLMKDSNLRTCCGTPICDDCVYMYITIQIEQGNVKIGCPNDKCDKYVHRDEVNVQGLRPFHIYTVSVT